MEEGAEQRGRGEEGDGGDKQASKMQGGGSQHARDEAVQRVEGGGRGRIVYCTTYLGGSVPLVCYLSSRYSTKVLYVDIRPGYYDRHLDPTVP